MAEAPEHAPENLSVKWILPATVVVTVVVLAILAGTWPIYRAVYLNQRPQRMTEPDHAFTWGPAWRSYIEKDMEAMEEENAELLNHRAAPGVEQALRIPLDDAMRLALDHGLPTWQEAAGDESAWHRQYVRVREEKLRNRLDSY